jgi:2-methylcitrate dehydratase
VSASNPIPPAKEAVTAKMSRWASTLQFKDIAPEAVYQAKRFLLDSLGCALGGYRQHDVTMALDVLSEIAGPGLATVFGSGRRFDPVSASLANALMIRCMDYTTSTGSRIPRIPPTFFPLQSRVASAPAAAAKNSSSASFSGTNLRCAFARQPSRESGSVAGITPL